MRRGILKMLAALTLAVPLAGCGFQLRGEARMPFDSAQVAAAAGSTLAQALRDALARQGKLAPDAAAAQVVIRLADEKRAKNILALSGGGKVREYRLEYRLVLSAQDGAGRELIAPAVIELNRDFSYDDEKLLAKEAEEAALNRGMEQEALRQVLRRLSYLRRG